jgi:hypothetical protein
MRECELFVCTRMREAAPVTPVAPGSEKFLWAKHIIMKFCCRHSKNLHCTSANLSKRCRHLGMIGH